MKKIIMLLAFLLIATSAYAEEKKDENQLLKLIKTAVSPVETILGPVTDLGQIVVAPTKTEEHIGASSTSITLISPSDAVKKGEIKVEETLRDVAGVDVSEDGYVGPTSVFLRGANSNQTLVLLDGIKMYDPISPNAAFNFAHLTLDNLESIEVLRGTQSALYGSDAIGGVINMTTRKAQNTFVNALFESGSYYTTHESFEMGAYVNRLHYTIGGSQFNTKGISQAKAKNNNPERDPYDRNSFSARMDYDITNNLTVGGTFRYTLAHFKYDQFGVDSPSICARQENHIFSQYIEQKLFDWWKYKINCGWMINLRRDYDDLNGPGTSYLRDYYYGKYFKVDYQNTFKILDIDNFIIGYDYSEEIGDSYKQQGAIVTDMSKAIARNGSFYLENRLNYMDRLTATQGMRVDHHSYAGTHVTYKFDGSYLFPTSTKVRGAIATGFRAPNLYQLNAPADIYSGGGNPTLKPETNLSYEYGLDQYFFGDKLMGSIVYFQNRFKNLIDAVYHSDTWYSDQYMNVNKAYSYGLETEFKFKPYNWLKSNLSYTWMQTKDLSTDSELLKRAKNKVKMQITWTIFPRLETDVTIRYVGPRMDWGNDKLKQYTTVDWVLNYELTKSFTIFGRIENLFNKQYEETRGDGEPGINAYGGVRAKF